MLSLPVLLLQFPFLWDYFVDEGRRDANLFCHNLFSALNLRKLQNLVCFDTILMTATFTQGNAWKGTK